MAKYVELRRHTASDGDRLTAQGVRDAVAIGGRVSEQYDLLVSSGAQRATQTLACMLAACAIVQKCGVVVDTDFRSEIEERWFAAAKTSGGGDLETFRSVDAELVDAEAHRFGAALRRIFDGLPEGGRALVVGHSPMQEAAVLGLAGEVVAPLSKGAGVQVTSEGGGYHVEPLP